MASRSSVPREALRNSRAGRNHGKMRQLPRIGRTQAPRCGAFGLDGVPRRQSARLRRNHSERATSLGRRGARDVRAPPDAHARTRLLECARSALAAFEAPQRSHEPASHTHRFSKSLSLSMAPRNVWSARRIARTCSRRKCSTTPACGASTAGFESCVCRNRSLRVRAASASARSTLGHAIRSARCVVRPAAARKTLVAQFARKNTASTSSRLGDQRPRS